MLDKPRFQAPAPWAVGLIVLPCHGPARKLAPTADTFSRPPAADSLPLTKAIGW